MDAYLKNDPLIRLQNTSDLEKLELDLVDFDLRLQKGELSQDIYPKILEARQRLEVTRAAHISLCQRLSSPAAQERHAALHELDRRINDGELKIFDPDTSRWRSATDLLLKATHIAEDLDRQDVERIQLEQALTAAVEKPHSLKELHALIHRAEELERRQVLTLAGKEALLKAHQVYENGLQNHRQITLSIKKGTLVEIHRALLQVKQLIGQGENRIFSAPGDQWRPAAEILEEAEEAYLRASAVEADLVLTRAESLLKVGTDAGLKALYLAMDKKIPYSVPDRQRIEFRYLEIYQSVGQYPPSSQESESKIPMSPEDLEGFKEVRERYLQKMKDLVNRSTDWLNQFFRSAVTRQNEILLDEAADESSSIAKTIERIEMAEALARKTLEKSIEIPEVMVRGAVILFQKGQAERARDLLARAKPLYTLERIDKVHRYAVTAWLQGCMEYYLGHRLNGYTEWKIARGYFNDLFVAARKEKQTEKANWYRDRLAEIEVQSIQTFEEIYFQWMNQFEPPDLPASLNDYRRMMDSLLGKQQVVHLRKTVQLFLTTSQQERAPEIYWKALVDAAFFEYQMRELMMAIDHLSQAWTGFQACHRGAVVLWLLGIVRWRLPSMRSRAINHWEESILIFRRLATLADHNNRQDRRIWYETQAGYMETCLKQWIQMTKPR